MAWPYELFLSVLPYRKWNTAEAINKRRPIENKYIVPTNIRFAQNARHSKTEHEKALEASLSRKLAYIRHIGLFTYISSVVHRVIVSNDMDWHDNISLQRIGGCWVKFKYPAGVQGWAIEQLDVGPMRKLCLCLFLFLFVVVDDDGDLRRRSHPDGVVNWERHFR